MTMLLSELLALHARGDVDREAGELVAEVAQAVALLQKKGSVTLTLSMEMAGGRILVAAEVTSKQPKPAPEAEMYFNGPAGLTKQDPLFNPGDPGKLLQNEQYQHPAGRATPVVVDTGDDQPLQVDLSTGEIVRPDQQETDTP